MKHKSLSTLFSLGMISCGHVALGRCIRRGSHAPKRHMIGPRIISLACWAILGIVCLTTACQPATENSGPSPQMETPTPVVTSAPPPDMPEDTMPPAPEKELSGYFSDDIGVSYEVKQALYTYYHTGNGQRSPERFEKHAADGVKIGIYAERPYHEGVLVVANFYLGGEVDPDLHYIEKGRVVYCTQYSDCWSINYTRLFGDTIVYGDSFAWDNGLKETTHATAAFMDGQTERVEMQNQPEGAHTGFIFVADGETWLSSLQLWNGDALAADDQDGQFVADPEWEPWKDSILSIRNRTRYAEMTSPEQRMLFWGRQTLSSVSAAVELTSGGLEESAGEGITVSLRVWDKQSELALSDLWRSNNHMVSYATAASASNFSLRLSNRPAYEEVEHMRWVELEADDGTQGSLLSCVTEVDFKNTTDWAPPAKKGHFGHYLLILETADSYYTAPFLIEK